MRRDNKWIIEKHKIKGKTKYKIYQTVANFAEINFFQKLLREEEAHNDALFNNRYTYLY